MAHERRNIKPRRASRCAGRAKRLEVAGATVLEQRLHSAARPIGVLGDGAGGTRVLVAVDEHAPFIAAITAR